jgi:ubiquinone/menaquinone biosynthesis C-methylase UbiE
LPEACCDAILLRLVYHAFDKPEKMRASMHRALRPGGRILIIDFRPDAKVLTQQMERSGFRARKTIDRWQDQQGVYAVLFVRN